KKQEVIMKVNEIIQVTAVICMVGLFSSLAVAHEDGDPRKGKYLWKKNCKTCHVEGEQGGMLSPSSKTQSQWSSIFEGDHDGAMTEKCKKFSQNDIHDIQHYMIDHALDTDQPETCS
ncbi:MAG TPA: cytochrome c, partial [Desulfopila sp.]|nr:cytochrome c [Desulfopila sp.]